MHAIARFLALLFSGALLWPNPAVGAVEGEKALGKFFMQCDSLGKPEAVYGCAMERAVQTGAIGADVAAACRGEIRPGVANPNAQIWNCAKRRQFAGQRSTGDWWNDTSNECDARSRTPGHRYQGRQHECIVDTAIAQRRVSDEQVQACRASPRVTNAHRMQNCLRDATRAPSTSGGSARAAHNAPAPGAGGQGGERNSKEACATYAQRHPLEPQLQHRFMRECRVSERSPESVADAVRAKGRELDQIQRQGDAAYPPERVLQRNRNVCERNNDDRGGGVMRYRCECVVQEARRQLDAGRIPAKTIAQQGFDMTACIDRPRTAQRYVSQTLNEGARRQLAAKNVDVEGMRACYVRAIEREMDIRSLNSFDSIRSELSQRCRR